MWRVPDSSHLLKFKAEASPGMALKFLVILDPSRLYPTPHSSANSGWIFTPLPRILCFCWMWNVPHPWSPFGYNTLEAEEPLWWETRLLEGVTRRWAIGGYSLTLPSILFSASCIVSSSLITVNLTMPLTLWWNNPLKLWNKPTFLLLRGTCNDNVKL